MNNTHEQVLRDNLRRSARKGLTGAGIQLMGLLLCGVSLVVEVVLCVRGMWLHGLGMAVVCGVWFALGYVGMTLRERGLAEARQDRDRLRSFRAEQASRADG